MLIGYDILYKYGYVWMMYVESGYKIFTLQNLLFIEYNYNFKKNLKGLTYKIFFLILHDVDKRWLHSISFDVFGLKPCGGVLLIWLAAIIC